MSPLYFRRRVRRGFTLVECLVVVLIISISLALGAQPLRDMRDRSRLSAQVARFVETINLARSEAVMRNAPVSICPSTLSASGRMECSGDYVDGWIVFSNADKDRVVDAGIDKVLRVFEGLPPGFTLTNRDGTRTARELINYLPDGSSRSNRTLLFCAPVVSRVAATSIVINRVGRPRLEYGGGSCPQSGSLET